MEVTVRLKNPPSGATMWSLSLTDWDITTLIHFAGWNGKERLDVAEPATFEIPEGVQFPLRIVSLQISKWNPERTALIVLYEVQSFRPYLWDFDIMDWGDEPDPTYREVFIPEYGNYYYDVATERFEGIAPPIVITTPDSAEEGTTVPVSVKVTNTLDIGYIFKTEIYVDVDLIFSTEEVIYSGLSKTYNTSFTMPANDVTIFAFVERLVDYNWIWHSVASKVVSFEAILYKGTISKKELEYDETRSIIPVF